MSEKINENESGEKGTDYAALFDESQFAESAGDKIRDAAKNNSDAADYAMQEILKIDKSIRENGTDPILQLRRDELQEDLRNLKRVAAMQAEIARRHDNKDIGEVGKSE